MRALSTLLLVSSLALSLPALPVARAADPVASVPEMELSRYAGHWYQIAHLPVSFQRPCAGDITVHYALRADGSIAVHNACRNHDGKQSLTQGVARRIEGHPGRLQVRYAPGWLSWLPLAWADYWVIALDPDYQWAVVGDPEHEYLWFLSREPSMDASLLARLRDRVEAMGYDLESLQVTAPLR